MPEAKPKSLIPAIRERDIELPSGRKVTVKELTMREQMMVDRLLVSAEDSNAVMYYRVIYSVQAIDGIALPEIDGKETATVKSNLDLAMDNLTGSEFTFLLRDYMTASGYSEIKN
jgi:hypothetical protein